MTKRPWRNWVLSFAFVVCFAAAVAAPRYIGSDGTNFNILEFYVKALNENDNITSHSLFGDTIAYLISQLIGGITAFILLIIGALLLSSFTVGKTPIDLARFLARQLAARREKAEENKRRREEYAEEEDEDEEESTLPIPHPVTSPIRQKKKKLDVNIEGPGDPAPDIEGDYVDENGDMTVPSPTSKKAESKEEPLTLKSIFTKKEDPEIAYRFKPSTPDLEEISADTDLPAKEEEYDAEIEEDVEIHDVTLSDEPVTPENKDEAEDGEMSRDDMIAAAVNKVMLGTPEEDEVPEEPEYVFPPVHLLKKAPPVTEEMHSEYEQTANKLVSTLASFGVKTRIINIAKGPTVTRYELQPETGVRVRAIRNLSDDIALSLAAKGVRIEAPIPGKEAVGIEVPNKNTSVVSIRSLIEAPAFDAAKSKLTTCLGVDVAGNPVYCDIAKMPHMMIAGTTGSGKSVCINSILMSILYKAKPDEVKLILIDPKKIELGVYNGIAHLLVPVVSDPKNAAGALAWSVNEMERRFALIEETGVREIKAYNEVALRDGNRELLPHIVIIIDELADLMMMARDTVESSIARIAQKARAAGMHLIIGTQRPSVDVITGLIKANVPSRIAFTVASQVDSRTIIDVVGAEKLVGKGDMLYSPVGAMNPMRVQGSFVSDSEIESVISFLKGNAGAEYDEEIMDSIEKEAAKCEKTKAKASDGDEDFGDDGDNSLNSDPMLRPAIEIAIDSGTISTSMLQRRLKLGYARAARLIDKMETLGIVSEFAGSKPRTVLISHEKYMEMVANSES
ncbi:MAG: DNA translocase FtsK [Ruminococcaceae bacterium]|nr:DNA translocase FtsK [Oscillospiraceae bacterium]